MNLVRLAGIFGFVAIALGAFGAHALGGRRDEHLIDVWKTGVLYHVVHTLAILLVAALGSKVARPQLVAGFFVAGIVIFSGSLYLLVLTEVRRFGAITPLGGVAFLTGWIVLAVSARRA